MIKTVEEDFAEKGKEKGISFIFFWQKKVDFLALGCSLLNIGIHEKTRIIPMVK